MAPAPTPIVKPLKHQLTEEGQRRLRDVVAFGHHLVKSKDIDPLYPVLSWIHDKLGLDKEQRYWHSFLYVAWYNLPSAQVAFDICPRFNAKGIDKLIKAIDPAWPTGIERRANRGGKVRKHIADYVQRLSEEYGWSQEEFYTRDLVPEALFNPDERLEHLHQNWRVLNERIQTIYGNGRWAAYKHLEILRRVNGLPLEAPDMGNQFSSGPREGLALLYREIEGQGAEVIAKLDSQGLDLQRKLAKRGLNLDIEELETLLCNWKSLYKGKYYAGHDIDEFAEQIDKAMAMGHLSKKRAELLWEARAATLPPEYLGEANGWHGVQKKRNSAYKRTGKVLVRKPQT